ncbi:MAG: RNA polymerase sigma factor RpoE [Gammaproteobacteria bacterium]|nr:MAG: RNA polymerase sigma factor RpoE [Gammaproteobacteria bacterium]
MSEAAIDKGLVLRAQEGDQRAFEALVMKYQTRVKKLVARFVRPADVDDVTQEAFIKAYRALDKFRGDSAFYTWLYRIAVNTAKNHLVSQSRRPPNSDIDIEDAEFSGSGERFRDNETPENSIATEELAGVVQKAIDLLPDELKTAILLREMEGLSYEEISSVMSCPIGTVRSRIFRAREAIENQIKHYMQGESGA